MARNKQYSAYDVSTFLSDSVGGLTSDIESLVIDMMNEDDIENRIKIKFEIQEIIEQINYVLS